MALSKADLVFVPVIKTHLVHERVDDTPSTHSVTHFHSLEENTHIL